LKEKEESEGDNGEYKENASTNESKRLFPRKSYINRK